MAGTTWGFFKGYTGSFNIILPLANKSLLSVFVVGKDNFLN
jgi:hypothetical protein